MKDTNKKPQLIKDFGLLLKAKSGYYAEDAENLPGKEGYMDPANVCMIIPLKKWVKDAIISIFDTGEPAKAPELDYKTITAGTAQSSKYSMDYLKIGLKLAGYYESVKISMKHEYPLTLETEDFKIILAPRVSHD